MKLFKNAIVLGIGLKFGESIFNTMCRIYVTWLNQHHPEILAESRELLGYKKQNVEEDKTNVIGFSLD